MFTAFESGLSRALATVFFQCLYRKGPCTQIVYFGPTVDMGVSDN